MILLSLLLSSARGVSFPSPPIILFSRTSFLWRKPRIEKIRPGNLVHLLSFLANYKPFFSKRGGEKKQTFLFFKTVGFNWGFFFYIHTRGEKKQKVDLSSLYSDGASSARSFQKLKFKRWKKRKNLRETEKLIGILIIPPNIFVTPRRTHPNVPHTLQDRIKNTPQLWYLPFPSFSHMKHGFKSRDVEQEHMMDVMFFEDLGPARGMRLIPQPPRRKERKGPTPKNGIDLRERDWPWNGKRLEREAREVLWFFWCVRGRLVM